MMLWYVEKLDYVQSLAWPLELIQPPPNLKLKLKLKLNLMVLKFPQLTEIAPPSVRPTKPSTESTFQSESLPGSDFGRHSRRGAPAAALAAGGLATNKILPSEHIGFKRGAAWLLELIHPLPLLT